MKNYVFLIFISLLNFIYAKAQINFTSPVYYETEENPNKILIDELNGDGKPDIIALSSHSVFILLNKGDNTGSFISAVNYNLVEDDKYITDGITGFFNNDNKADLAVIHHDTLSLLLNKGDGTFEKPLNTFLEKRPVDISKGDVNKDGKIDIVLVIPSLNSFEANNSILIFLGNGDGTFKKGNSYETEKDAYLLNLDDINGDGNLDIIVTNGYTLSIFLGKGDREGIFEFKADYSVKSLFSKWLKVATGHINEDNYVDVVVKSLDSLHIFLGKADGTLNKVGKYGLSKFYTGLTIGDIDNNNKTDIVLSIDSITILPGKGDGAFSKNVNILVDGETLYDIALSDFNEDSKMDIAVVSGSSGLQKVMSTASKKGVFVLLSNNNTSISIEQEKNNLYDITVRTENNSLLVSYKSNKINKSINCFIYDTRGTLIAQQLLTNGEDNIFTALFDISQFSQGTYLVVVSDHTGCYQRKFVKL